MLIRYVDTLRELLPAPTGWIKDEAASMPNVPLPNRVYLFPIRLGPQRLEEDDGRWDEARLNLRCAISAAAKGETRTMQMDRATSIILDNAVDAVVFAIAANRRDSYGLWWDAFITNIQYDAVRGFDCRIHYVDMTIRMIPPEGLA